MVGFGTQYNAYRGIFVGTFYISIKGFQVKFQLSEVSWMKLCLLQFYRHQGLQTTMIEQKVCFIRRCANIQFILLIHEYKILSQFKDKLLHVFRVLPKDISSDVFSYMEDTEQQAHVVESISNHEVRALIDDLFLDDTVDFLEEMPANVVKRILANTDADTRAMINKILQYPDDSAGSLMTTEYLNLKADMTVSEAFVRIRRIGEDKETINTLYVTDKDRHLIGVLSIRNLLLADPDDETSVISHIGRADFARLVADGVVAGGMIPKIENSLAAVEAGVARVIIPRADALVQTLLQDDETCDPGFKTGTIIS